MQNPNNMLARAACKAGMILMESGAETNRVEDTMARICHAYGATVVDSFATTDMLIVSFSMPDGNMYHNIKRASLRGVDLYKIERVNELSRQTSTLSIEQLYKELMSIDQSPTFSLGLNLLSAAICCASFAWLLQASLATILCAAGLGMFLHAYVYICDNRGLDSFVKNFVGGALATLIAIGLQRIGWCDSMHTLIVSTIIVLTPGMMITEAIRDSANGDSISGMSRTKGALLVGLAIALGTQAILHLMGVSL